MHRAFAMSDDRTIPPTAACAPARADAVPASLRSVGEIDLAFIDRSGVAAVSRAFQSGCLRMRMPRTSGEEPCAVLINTAGGLAEGDRLVQGVTWAQGVRSAVATQAAEKVYRALDQGSQIATRLHVEQGAQAEWLPQETILFDEARLVRDTQIALAQDSSFLGVEALVLGREAMGESVTRGALRDRLRIWRGGKLIYADTLALEGDIADLMAHAAVGGRARAMAVIVHVANDSAALLEPVRSALETARGQAAASAWNGILAVRLIAPDGEILRREIAATLEVMRKGRALPRVWRC